jgi:hypothetical protein
MDVAIIAAVIGAFGSIVATVIGVVLTHRLERQSRSGQAASQQPGSPIDKQPTGDPRYPSGNVQLHIGIAPLFCVAIGSFLAITGAALFGYAVVAFIVAIFNALLSGVPPDLSSVPLATFVPLGIGLVFAGGVVLWIGMLLAGFRTFRKV